MTPQSIYLEGTLPHESQILVSDAETTTSEEILGNDTDDQDHSDDSGGHHDEPAIVLSSKMTLSLISLDPVNRVQLVIDDDEVGTD